MPPHPKFKINSYICSVKTNYLFLITFIGACCMVVVPAKADNLMVVRPVVSVVYAQAPDKKPACKVKASIKKYPKAKQALSKVAETHFYSGTLDMLAQLFPVLLNLTQPIAPEACTEV
jgi:hypothetical protein